VAHDRARQTRSVALASWVRRRLGAAPPPPLRGRSPEAGPPLVSHIVPTYKRPDRHESLYACFCESAWPNKELLIADELGEPSPFFLRLRDRRVRYWHSGKRTTIGDKRNFLVHKARGQIVQHQDDDDHYAQGYTHAMVARLSDCDLVKLSVFNILHERDGSKWRWDTRSSGGGQALFSSKFKGLCISVPFGLAVTDVTLWGFGFSYVYRRELALRVPFPGINRREDYEFVRQARAAGARCKQVADCADLVWHHVHDMSTSACFPQVRLDGPTPIPLTNILAGSALGGIFGVAIGGPLGAVAGAGVATMCSAGIVRHALRDGATRGF